MSDTTSKREREDDSQSGAVEAADEDDDDLDAALFGDDGNDADESPADAVAAPLEGRRAWTFGVMPFIRKPTSRKQVFVIFRGRRFAKCWGQWFCAD